MPPSVGPRGETSNGLLQLQFEPGPPTEGRVAAKGAEGRHVEGAARGRGRRLAPGLAVGCGCLLAISFPGRKLVLAVVGVCCIREHVLYS